MCLQYTCEKTAHYCKTVPRTHLRPRYDCRMVRTPSAHAEVACRTVGAGSLSFSGSSRRQQKDSSDASPQRRRSRLHVAGVCTACPMGTLLIIIFFFQALLFIDIDNNKILKCLKKFTGTWSNPGGPCEPCHASCASCTSFGNCSVCQPVTEGYIQNTNNPSMCAYEFFMNI